MMTTLLGGVLMDLSEAFDFTHDLLIGKHVKTCVRSSTINSDFNNIISEVPQGSVVGPILFKAFFDFFFFMQHATVHTFADDNTLANSDKFKALVTDKKRTNYTN